MSDMGGMSGMSGLHQIDLRAAIDWWRDREPAAPELAALQALLMSMAEQDLAETDVASVPELALQAWLDWYDSTPDSPCIAICTTAQGDATCKGCGRSFDEVQNWLGLQPTQKRAVWRRITLDGTAWRFNRYAERS